MTCLRRVKTLSTVASTVLLCSCTPSTPPADPTATPSNDQGATPPAPAASPTGLYRLRNTAFLEAQRDTAEGYLAAAKAFKKSLALKELPNDLLNLARVYILADAWAEDDVEQWEEALKAITRYRAVIAAKGISADDVPPDADYLEGLALNSLMRSEAATEKFRRAATSAPEVSAAWFQLGATFMSQRRYEEAIEAFLKVIAIAPENVAAHFRISRCYVFLRKMDEYKKWEKMWSKLNATSGKVHERHYEKCRFTKLTLIPQQRKLAEPPTVALHFERATLPEELASFRIRDLVIGDFDRLADVPTEDSGEAAKPGELVEPVDPVRRAEPAPVAEQVELIGEEKTVRLKSEGDRFVLGQETPLKSTTDPTQGAAWDYDNDGALDLLLLDDGRLRVLRKVEAQHEERTVAGLDGRGIVAMLPTDYDHDGDIDVLTIETTHDSGGARIYRNNGDSSFLPLDDVLPGATGSGWVAGEHYRLCAVDLDRGNDTDFLIPNPQGATVAQMNLRAAGFRRAEIDDFTGQPLLASFDLDNDGDMDIVGASHQAGAPLRIARHGGVRGAARLPTFEMEEVAIAAELGRIHDSTPADIDSDGDLDLIVAAAGGLLLLRNEDGGQLRPVPPAEGLGPLPPGPWRRVETADLDFDCRLDVLAIGPDDRLFVWLNRAETYKALALSLTGNRDNITAIGTHVEVYCGEGYQRLRVEKPRRSWVGLGVRSLEEFDGIGLTWPNGLGQAVEPALLTDCVLSVRQRMGLMSSCPFLYTHDGTAYRFLTDVIAIAPLDEWLPPGGQPHIDPEEFVRIPSDRLQAIDGELRMVITEELCETTYLDRAVLLRVSHPENTVVYVDESTRQGTIEPLQVFIAQTTALRTTQVRTRNQPSTRATRAAAVQDGEYLQGFDESLPQWAGWVEPFTLEIELPFDLQGKAPALLLTGRIAWFDSATAYSLHQHGRAWLPHSLDVLDGTGTARSVLGEVGFPAGMDRTIVAPLAGTLDASSRMLRLTSTHRLLWDQIQLADETATTVLTPGSETSVKLAGEALTLRTEALRLRTCDLDYHGFSKIVGDFARHMQTYDFSSPTVWRDFQVPAGTATRYGDVRELVTEADDELVVLPPGDAVWLAFESGSAPPEGQTVTYFLKLTGWAKESAFHVSSGSAIAPLPYADMSTYPEGADLAPTSAAYKKYLSKYQTRTVAGDPALLPR